MASTCPVRRAALAAALAGVAFGLTGCPAGKIRREADPAQKSGDLRQVGLLYKAFQEKHPGMGPGGTPDLLKVAETPGEKDAIALVGSAQYVVVWGVSASDVGKLPDGAGVTVLAYEKDAPTAGGAVLMADGSVKTMTVEEFDAAPKAKPAPKPKPDEAAARRQKADDLRRLGRLYFRFMDAHGRKVPSVPADLRKVAEGPDEQKAVALAEAGDYVLPCGLRDVELARLAEASPDRVWGYEKGAPKDGGMVLFADGSVRGLTAAEFDAAPKVKKAG